MKQNELERLKQEAKKPSIGDLFRDGIVQGLDPDAAGNYEIYQDDPVGFVSEVLGATLWSKQVEMLEAVRDTEIVHIRSATGVGKTFGLAQLAIWIYKAYPGSQVYTTTAPPEANLKRLLWAEIYSLTKEFPELFADDDIRASMFITRHPKEFITGVTIPVSSSDEDIETKWSGKHAPVIVFEADEGDGIPDPVYKGMDGCMSGGMARQIICYNPKKKSGEIYRREKEGRALVIEMSALDHPNVLTGEDIIPGAVTRAKTVERIHLWTEPKPLDMDVNSTCWEIPEFLYGVTGKMNDGTIIPPLLPGIRVVIDNQFWYKVLGQYPPGGVDRLIWDEWIDMAVSKWELMRAAHDGIVTPPAGIQPTMGLDVADFGPDHHSACFRYGMWVDVPELWKDSDPSDAADKAARMYIRRDAKMCKVDATGVGAGTPGNMVKWGRRQTPRKRIVAVRVMVAESARGTAGVEADYAEFFQLRDESYWTLRTVFRKGEIAIPPETYNEACRRLHDSLKAVDYEITGKNLIRVTTKQIMRKRLTFSPDEMEALMLSYALENTWMGGIRKKA